VLIKGNPEHIPAEARAQMHQQPLPPPTSKRYAKRCHN
jgi:hypothetical protein